MSLAPNGTGQIQWFAGPHLTFWLKDSLKEEPHPNLTPDSGLQPNLCPNLSISPLRAWHAPHLWPPPLIFPGIHLPSRFGQLSKGTPQLTQPMEMLQR